MIAVLGYIHLVVTAVVTIKQLLSWHMPTGTWPYGPAAQRAASASGPAYSSLRRDELLLYPTKGPACYACSMAMHGP